MSTASGGDLEYALSSRAADDEASGVALCCPETSNRRRQTVQEGGRCHGNLPIPEATVRLGTMRNARSMLQTGISQVDQRVSICPLGTIGKFVASASETDSEHPLDGDFAPFPVSTNYLSVTTQLDSSSGFHGPLKTFVVSAWLVWNCAPICRDFQRQPDWE